MTLELNQARAWSPPWEEQGHALWILGEPPRRRGVAVVGARAADPYGLQVAAQSARSAVALGWSVVSGGAEGCDRAAHEAAIEAGGHTLVVLAGGLDRLYPASHERLFSRVLQGGGALVTAYPLGTPPRPHRFLERNRLIAQLSAAVVVARARGRSGALSTARAARSLGRPVLAVPGPVGSALSVGGHRLLESGAHPMTSGRSLTRALRVRGDDPWPITNHPVAPPFQQGEPRNFDDLVTSTPEGEVLIQALLDHRVLDLAGFSRLTRLPIQVVMTLLVELEVAGVVLERQGSYHLRQVGCSASR